MGVCKETLNGHQLPQLWSDFQIYENAWALTPSLSVFLPLRPSNTDIPHIATANYDWQTKESENITFIMLGEMWHNGVTWCDVMPWHDVTSRRDMMWRHAVTWRDVTPHQMAIVIGIMWIKPEKPDSKHKNNVFSTWRPWPLSLTIELGREVIKVSVNTKFRDPRSNSSAVRVFTNWQTHRHTHTHWRDRFHTLDRWCGGKKVAYSTPSEKLVGCNPAC